MEGNLVFFLIIFLCVVSFRAKHIGNRKYLESTDHLLHTAEAFYFKTIPNQKMNTLEKD
jgi:hypothetical protein